MGNIKKASNPEASKAESKHNYTVRVTNEFTTISSAGSRTRSGVVVPAGEGYTGPLTDAQLKEIGEDQYLTVTKG